MTSQILSSVNQPNLEDITKLSLSDNVRTLDPSGTVLMLFDGTKF